MLGCIYGLIAMGFVIVFKATNVVNFAHASIVMLGAFLVAKWHESLGLLRRDRRSGGRRARWPPRCSTSSSCARCAPQRAAIDALAIMTIALNILLGTELVRVGRERPAALRRAVGREDDRRRSAPRSRRRASRRPSSRWC